MKTNKELVAYATAQLGKPYWFGTFGQIATDKLLVDKAKQYPRQYSAKRIEIAKAQHLGNRVHDCYGLYKGFLMSKSPIDPAVYDKQFDISADVAFSRSTEKGTIDTLPEIEGIGLWKKGHFGIYCGGGEEIEARGFDKGVVKDKVSNTKFTHWFKLPEIEYVESSDDAQIPHEDAPVSAPSDSSVEVYIVKQGDSLSRIAAKYGVSVSDLVKWNNIKNPDLIVIGQKIEIKALATSDPVKEFFIGKVTTNSKPLNIRSGSGTSFAVIGTLPKGAEVKIAYETAGWGKLYGQAGFVCMNFITII